MLRPSTSATLTGRALLHFGSDQSGERSRQCAVVALHVELKVEP